MEAPTIVIAPLRCTLMHVFERSDGVGDLLLALERFLPLRGLYTDIAPHPRINDPISLDVDAACFMMLTWNLPSLFGIMAQPANMVIRIRNSPKFTDWLHVVSDHVVVKVFARRTEDEVRSFRDDVVEMLGMACGLTLTPNHDYYLL